MDRLKGKRVIITGAAVGMGRSEAELFAGEGARVIATDTDLIRLQAWVDQARASGHDITALRHDVTSSQDWDIVMSAAAEKLGGLDVLVNNAGVYPPGLDNEACDRAAWDRVLANDESSFITGAELVVDGGMIAR